MATFSSNDEDVINRNVIVEDNTLPCSPNELIDIYSLDSCLEWIKKNNFSKICLQFPDSLLIDSVAVSLWLENKISHKVFILGDTSYGSCCIDEIAAEHINADALIHFGHACLSPVTRLPVLYIFPKFPLCVSHFISELRQHCQQHKEQVLLLYDVEYEHCIDEIRENLEDLKERVIISELCVSEDHKSPCCQNCCLHDGEFKHQVIKLRRAFCSRNVLSNIVYICKKNSQNLENFIMSLTGVNVYAYNSQSLLQVNATKNIKRRLYLTERLKDAKTIGILIATLGITHFLTAVESIRKLATRKGKKCYIISVGKPSVPKLANFPEIEVFVMVCCPEAVIENEKEYLQPIVTLMEAELALNEDRQWTETISADFTDLLPGGDNYIPLPEKDDVGESDVSLVTNRIRSSVNEVEPSSDHENLHLVVRQDLSVSVTEQGLASKSWHGLEQALGKTPVTKATMGRSGIPQNYESEGYLKPAD